MMRKKKTQLQQWKSYLKVGNLARKIKNIWVNKKENENEGEEDIEEEEDSSAFV